MIVAELAASLGLIPDEASWDKGHELIEGLHNALEAYLGYQGLQKVKELITGTVEAAVEAKHLGERLSITSEAVQELGYAADVTGASAQTITSAMQRLAAGMEHAKKGTGPLVDAMTQLGVPIANLRKEKLDQNLEEIANGFAHAKPSVDKLALSIQIFGRQAGPRLLPLLNRGAEGIKKLREEAQSLGVVMGDEAVEKAEEFEIAQKKLGATLKGVRNEAVVAMLPALQEMVESLTEWVHENREAIASGLQAFLEGLAAAFKFVGHAIYEVIEFFREHEDALFVLMAVMATYLATLIYTAAASAIAWAIAFLPLTLGIAAVGGLVLGLKALYEYITGESVTLEEMWEGFLQGGRDALDWLEDLPDNAAKWIGQVAQDIKDAFKAAWDFAVQSAKEAWSAIEGIPIIGHIVRGAEWVGGQIVDTLSGGGPATSIANSFTKIATGGFTLPGAAATGGGAPSYNFGDVHVKVDAAGMSPEEAKAAMRDVAGETLTDAIRIAHANITGGKR